MIKLAFNVSGKCPNCGEPIHASIIAAYEDEDVFVDSLEDTNIVVDMDNVEFKCPSCGEILYIVADIQWGLATDQDNSYTELNS